MNIKIKKQQHVFIIGAKSLGAYGGYETFVDKLTEYHKDNGYIQYHVACKANGIGAMDIDHNRKVNKLSDDEFQYNNAHCFLINVPNIGSLGAIYYDVAALNYCLSYIKNHNIENPIVYILACRIGPFIKYFYNKFHALGAKIYLNPDGHEWKRAKWPYFVKKYWKLSEKLMVKYSDFAICDSKNIESYIHECYDHKGINRQSPKTTFIAYGADIANSELSDDSDIYLNWQNKFEIKNNNYYLIVGRFVPENNYETMIREFMLSNSQKDLVIITNENQKLFNKLNSKLHFSDDSRIKFVGTVYDQQLLKKIRENAFAYIHGHEVGGTNPSLLEALASTNLNLLLDVGFNREVAEDAALYWNKTEHNLSNLIDKLECSKIDSSLIGDKAKNRIKNEYSWKYISDLYLKSFNLENLPIRNRKADK